MSTSITLNPLKTAKFLLSIIAVLFALHLMFVFTQLVYGYQLRHIFKMFDFNSEGNFPTMYSVFAILFAALLLLFVGFIKRKKREKFAIQWLALGAIFLFMAYDEAAKMHEQLNTATRSILPESSRDFLYFAWVIPYAILALIVGISYFKFLVNLPKKTAVLFVAAGATYITGALGFEMLTSYFRYEGGYMIHLVITIEETLEMLGIVLFIYSILDYIKGDEGSISI